MFGKVLMGSLGLKQLLMQHLQYERIMQAQFTTLKCGSQGDKMVQPIKTMFGTVQMESLGLKQEQEQSLPFEHSIRQWFLTTKCKSTADIMQEEREIHGKVLMERLGHEKFFLEFLGQMMDMPRLFLTKGCNYLAAVQDLYKQMINK